MRSSFRRPRSNAAQPLEKPAGVRGAGQIPLCDLTETLPSNESKSLRRSHSISDLRAIARKRLPAAIWNFLEGAAETEITARRNTSAFDDTVLISRCLVDVSAVKTRTRILGQDVEWPVFCSPTGASRLFHPHGELAVAKAASKAGTIYALATGATHALETVAAETNSPKMFQLYVFKDRDLTRELIDRSKRAGYNALCLTVDAPVSGKRERDLRSGLSIPPSRSLSNLIGFVRHPRWVAGQLVSGRFAMANLAHRSRNASFGAQSAYFTQQLDPSVTWKDVREIADLWGGPLALKGIMSADDALHAADVGVNAVIVSNHGGRQLDGAAAAIDVLPEIARAVKDRLDVVLDGGVRRGVHVLKALACGAKACSIGRPYLYGLSAGGEAGVARALTILRQELILAMQLAGCNDVRDINGRMVKRLA